MRSYDTKQFKSLFWPMSPPKIKRMPRYLSGSIAATDGRTIYINRSRVRNEAVKNELDAQKLEADMLFHEASHLLYTGELLRGTELDMYLFNALEDERVERRFNSNYGKRFATSKVLGQKIFAANDLDIFTAVLARRYFQDMSDSAFQKKMTSGLGIWDKVESIVYEAWEAETSEEVWECVERIIKCIPIEEQQEHRASYRWDSKLWSTLTDTFKPSVFNEDEKEKREGSSDEDDDECGVGAVESGRARVKLDEGDPSPYVKAVEGSANLLREAIVQEATVKTLPHAYNGRYSFRQELHDADRPCLVVESTASLLPEVVVAVDESGSMGHYNDQIKEVLTLIYLAMAGTGKLKSIIYFGTNIPSNEDDDYREVDLTSNRRALEQIAGYDGQYGQEMMYWALEEGKRKFSPEQARRIIFVIHDGQPVYRGARGNDLELSTRFVATNVDITIIGIYVGDKARDVISLKQIFGPERFIRTNSSRLVSDLEMIFRSL